MNEWPYKKRMPERAGEASRSFDGDGSTGKPKGEYEDKDLGEFGAGAPENLNVKGGERWPGDQPELPDGAGIKFGRSSSITAEQSIGDIARPGAEDKSPRASKLTPHS